MAHAITFEPGRHIGRLGLRARRQGATALDSKPQRRRAGCFFED